LEGVFKIVQKNACFSAKIINIFVATIEESGLVYSLIIFFNHNRLIFC